MNIPNRYERRLLRRIQEFRRAALLENHTVVEQLGTVDVFFHPNNPDPAANCITPHKGVAWVRREDLRNACAGLERLGRAPRLIFQAALFPEAFRRQLLLMGLQPESAWQILVYRPLYGPAPAGESLYGQLPSAFHYDVTASVASDATALRTWLRVFQAGYYRTDSAPVDQAQVADMVRQAAAGRRIFVLASYRGTPLGAARVSVRDRVAELEAVVTEPYWEGMGLEEALVTTGVRAAEGCGCDLIFTLSPPQEPPALYRRLGFLPLTKLLIYRRQEEDPAEQKTSTARPQKGETTP